MAFPQGIAFRATAGFVTDAANDDAEIGTTANYPRTTAQGNSVGWEQAPGGTRDRNSGVDSRLAGIAFVNKNESKDYRIDLPATGDYTIRLAAGDVSFSTQIQVELFDGTTSLAVIGDLSSTGGAARFYDASGVLRTSVADWVANNASITKTFATTILRMRLSGGTGSTGDFAYLYIESAGGGTTDAVGSASGTSTASGVGASTATSTGSSTGAGSATGVGASTAAAVGSASGSATVSGVGVASTGSTGTAAGTSTASGVGASVAASVGSAEGSATVSGVGSSTSAGAAVGTASGVATVSGVGASVAAAVGEASGGSSVFGVSPEVVVASGKPDGAPGHRIKFRGRFYDSKRDRYRLARDVESFLAEKQEEAPQPQKKPRKRVIRTEVAEIRIPKVALDTREIDELSEVLTALKARDGQLRAYIAQLKAANEAMMAEEEEFLMMVA